MTPLDSETDEGRLRLVKQYAALDRFLAAYPHEYDDCLSTTPTCRVDGVLTHEGRVVAVAEVRSRQSSLATLRARGSYLLTAEKLYALRDLSRLLACRAILIAYLEDALVWWLVADDGEYRVRFTEDHTETQATVNGGRIVRLNAYIALDAMVVVED